MNTKRSSHFRPETAKITTIDISMRHSVWNCKYRWSIIMNTKRSLHSRPETAKHYDYSHVPLVDGNVRTVGVLLRRTNDLYFSVQKRQRKLVLIYLCATAVDGNVQTVGV